MKAITTDSHIQRDDRNLIISELDDDLVMMNIESGSYLSVNKTGRIIWDKLEQPIVVNDLIKQLRSQFSVDELTCTTETLAFLNKIAEQKALKIV
jgi:hypothetical protein